MGQYGRAGDLIEVELWKSKGTDRCRQDELKLAKSLFLQCWKDVNKDKRACK